MPTQRSDWPAMMPTEAVYRNLAGLERSSRMSRVLTAMATAIVLGMATAPAPAAETGKAVVVNGSTTVGQIAEAIAAKMMEKDPSLKITVAKTGSGDGAAAL